MNLVIIIMAPLFGALLPLLLKQTPRLIKTGVTLLIPLTGIAILLSYAPQTLSGDTPKHFIEWLPSIGLDFAIRLDGLSLLFCSLILGIGVLIMVMPTITLHDDDSRFYACSSFYVCAGHCHGTIKLLGELTVFSFFLIIAFTAAMPAAPAALATIGRHLFANTC